MTSNVPTPQQTLEERELLIPEVTPHTTGFKPRPVERLTDRRPPTSMLSIECRHFLRSDTASFTHQHPDMEFRLWMEASKHEPPCPERPDESYNSNVWRNFRQHVGFSLSADGRKVSDVIAAMYPVNIPPPSRVGDYTFEKYITENKLFSKPRTRALALERVRQTLKDSERQRLRSEARFPPLDTDGRILPPLNFKHYAHRFVPVPEVPPTPPPANQKTDLFGQRYVPKSQPHLHKLVHRLNHPDYERVQEELAKRRDQVLKQRQSSGSRQLPTPINPSSDSGRLLLHSQ